MRDWRNYTHKTLQQLGIRPTKTMGQNFLIRYKVVHDIIIAAKIKPSDHILEIGGGLGILSHAILSVTDNLTIIEKDPVLAKHLEKTYPEITVIQGDALKVEWPENVKLIANLPYSISSPIIKRIMHQPILSAIVMVQKEIADRCMSKPGRKDYGRLAVLCSLHSKVSKVFNIDPDAFQPRPKVLSTVIRIDKKEIQLSNSHEEIELLSSNLFTLKRRILRSVLRGFLKRKVDDESVWNNVPYADKRINTITTNELDEILTYLKNHTSWPIA